MSLSSSPVDSPPWYTDADEGYWQAIVSQGRWADEVAPRSDALAAAEWRPPENDAQWTTLATLFTDGAIVPLTVTGFNKGGLLVDWEGMQGFIPTSQLADAPVLADEGQRMECLARHVGRATCGKVIELDRGQNRIIFSERASRWGKCCPDTILAMLKAGDICEGDVSNLCDFGVFVDLGGVDGLIHISELSWRRISHPSELLDVGQRLRVYVIDVNPQRRRIALSLKRLEPNPWATVAERYQPGMIVEGIITNIVEFGAFARIEDGVEGLVHISELAGSSGDDAITLCEGQPIRARILSVDPAMQRMGLSLRAVSPP